MATQTMWLTVLLVSSLHAQELTTPSSLLGPRNFNHHPYEQYLREVDPEPTQQGPVLFPNDGPPPPRPPLIVTSRPLIESIARSDLNPLPINNSVPSSSRNQEYRIKPDYLRNIDTGNQEYRIKPDYSDVNQIEPVFLPTIKPGYLSRATNYQPFVYPVTSPSPLDFGPYAKVLKKHRNGLDNRYDDFEERTALPPIYKAIGDFAKQKVLKLKHKPNHTPLHNIKPHRHEKLHNDDSPDYDNDGSNYAFSYRVKDHKTGDDFSHRQHSSGSATNGEYRVRLPDGRMQIVSYTADENGYNADVRYDDEDKIKGNAIDNHNHINQDYNNHIHNQVNHNHINHDHDHINHNHINHKPQKFDPNDYIDNRRDYIKHLPNPINYYDFNHNTNDNANDNYDPSKYFTKPTETYKVKEDFNEYTDLSKEYNTDYSVEYDGKHGNYEPHKSKFSLYTPKSTNLGTIVVTNNVKNKHFATDSTPRSTVRPSYQEIKHLFENQNYSPPNIEINVPSTTPNSNDFDGTTERVVIIGTKPNLYTNIKNIPLVTTPATIFTSSSYNPSDIGSTSDFVSPQKYLVSTIQSLKDRGHKPILSQNFINKINKYLTFTK